MPEANKNKPTMPLIRPKVGTERVRESLKEATEKSGFLHDGVMYDDIDKEFTKAITEDFKLVDYFDSEKVIPVYFFNIQRWTEYQENWENTDKNKNMKLPFISVVRQPNPQVGTQRGGYYNIPGKRHYEFYKVPTFDGNREGLDLYKVPQPMPVDITYEVKMFTYKIELLNDFNALFLDKYKSLEYYIKPKGLWMKTTLESIDDESQLSNIDSRKYYVQTITIKIGGYIIDPKDFIVEKSITRVVSDITIDLKSTSNYKDTSNMNEGNFQQVIDFLPGVNYTTMSFKSTGDYNINSISLEENVESLSMTVDGVDTLTDYMGGTITPIDIVFGDRIIINIFKTDIVEPSQLVLFCEKKLI